MYKQVKINLYLYDTL